MSYSGKYTVKNKQKYRGDISKVTYRSLWELTVMKHLDLNPQVKWWNSECSIIPYFSKADGKNRRYFMDFTVCYLDDSIHLWEVKPASQTQPPKPPGKMTSKAKQNFQDAIYTWQVNLDKWTAAKKIAEKKGWNFKILTEHTLRNRFGMRI